LLESLSVTRERLLSAEEFFRNHKLSVDHDGVIGDTKGSVAKSVNEIFGTEFTASDINDWHWVINIALEHGWSYQKAKKLNDEQWFDPISLFRVPPTNGAVGFMKWFYDRGIEISVITSRKHDLETTTRQWYEKYMPFMDQRNIIISKSDEMRGDYFKIWAIKYLVKPAIHIEDSTHHAENIINYTDTIVAFMSSSRILDRYQDSQLIRLMDTGDLVSLEGVREKIVQHPISQNVAQY